MQAKVRGTYVDPAIVGYSVRLVTATRSPAAVGLGDLDRYVTYGASPRASIALVANCPGTRLPARPRLRAAARPRRPGARRAASPPRCSPTRPWPANVDPGLVVTRVLRLDAGPAWCCRA